MNGKRRAVFAIVAMAFISVIIYIFIHESGHGIIAALCGAHITRLSIVEAHTWWTGGDFTSLTLALCFAAGVLLPVCISFIGVIFYKRNYDNPVYRLMYPWCIIISTAALSVWVLFPIMSMFISLPVSDDVAKFLRSSGLHPMLVSFVSAALMLVMILLIKRKGMFQNLISTLKAMINPETDGKVFFSKRSIRGLTVAVLLVISVTVLLELPDKLSRPVITIAATGEIDEAGLEKSFEIRRAGDYHFDIQLDVKGTLADVRVCDSEQKLVYQTLTEKAFANGTFYLNDGECTISVIPLPDINTFRQYCKDMNYGFDEEAVEEMESVYEHEVQPPYLSFVIKQ